MTVLKKVEKTKIPVPVGQSNPVCPVTLLSKKSRFLAFIMPKSISISHHFTLFCRFIDNWNMR
jgi:hypothetical protein